MATTRPRDHRAMAARPPTRAADSSSALLQPSTWSLGHLVTSLLMMATTWFGDLSAAAPPRPSTWFRDSSAATPPRPHLRVVPLLVDKVVGDILWTIQYRAGPGLLKTNFWFMRRSRKKNFDPGPI
jgi:hypothetical protein